MSTLGRKEGDGGGRGSTSGHVIHVSFPGKRGGGGSPLADYGAEHLIPRNGDPGGLVSSEKLFPLCGRTASGVPFLRTLAAVDKQGLAANGRGLAGEWLTPAARAAREAPQSGPLTDKDASKVTETPAGSTRGGCNQAGSFWTPLKMHPPAARGGFSSPPFVSEAERPVD